MDTNSTGEAKTSASYVLDHISAMSSEAGKLREKCTSMCSLIDEATYKIDAVLNIINNLKVKEQAIVESGGDQAVLQQITEEQIDSFLELLKTPTFQSLIKQLLYKWAAPKNV